MTHHSLLLDSFGHLPPQDTRGVPSDGHDASHYTEKGDYALSLYSHLAAGKMIYRSSINTSPAFHNAPPFSFNPVYSPLSPDSFPSTPGSDMYGCSPVVQASSHDGFEWPYTTAQSYGMVHGWEGMLSPHDTTYSPAAYPPSLTHSPASVQSTVSLSPSPSTSSIDLPDLKRRRLSTASTSSEPKSCSHCGATSTPLWRREPGTQRPLCNACGLYLQQRHKLRPKALIDADAAENEEEEYDPTYNGPECSHCHTRHTSVWRRSKNGSQLCNACGVYQRLRGKDRPLSLRRNKVKPRTKHATK